MHVRESKRRRGSKVYRYAQIVQSYRRPDGMPAHKVIVSLGPLPPLEVENLRRAFKASRLGQHLLLPSEVATNQRAFKVRANLTYLDVAIVRLLWKEWELGPLLDELIAPSESVIPHSDVIEALVAHRCVKHDSKLAAQQWYPKTALPELQGIAPKHLNNTRIHRSLARLEAIEAPLQQRLTRRIDGRGNFTALYLDMTDTWFEGRGPEMAAKGTTKEGLLRRRIGILMLCDDRGYPLRWATVPGNYDEARVMRQLLREIVDQPWMEGVPLAVDRAMGRGVTLGALLAHNIRFVTAVPAPEIRAYTQHVPLGGFDHLDLDGVSPDDPKARKALHKAALDQGFEQVGEDRFVMDLGIVERVDGPLALDLEDEEQLAAAPTRAVAALDAAHRVHHERTSGAIDNLQQLADRWGCAARSLRSWASLLKLTEEVQHQIRMGLAHRLSLDELLRIAALEPSEQLPALRVAAEQAKDHGIQWPTQALAKITNQPWLQVRAVLLFSPARFLEKRCSARENLDKLEAFVADTNSRLRSPHCRRTRDSVLALVGGELRHRKWSSLFHAHVDEVEHEGRTVFQVRVERDEIAWRHRYQTNGLTLIVGHPELPMSAAHLVEQYFAKDLVEKDFQVIKSVLQLRPLRHRTDLKVRAHVSLCMLALLLERTLEQRLRHAGIPMTAASAFQELASCHLNLYADTPTPIYSATEATPTQRRILAALGCEDFAEDDAIHAAITPR